MPDSDHSIALPAFWLSMHVGYACRDEGACCSSGWPIPIERPQAQRVREAVDGGRFRAPAVWLRVSPGQPADVAGLVAADASGGCVFHRSRRCDLQTALGQSALPSCCQHFPRDCVIDDRGVFVTLSHYCPTAARLLFNPDAPLEIVHGPPPVPGAVAEGLDARDALPPLLTRRVLMDLPGLTAWQSHQVDWLGGRNNPDGRLGPEAALRLLELRARRLSTWRPGGMSLADAVISIRDEPCATDSEPDWDFERAGRELARQALVPSCAWPDDPDGIADRWNDHRSGWRAQAAVVNRFLAAHAFASWMAYQGDGVVSGIRLLRLVLGVLRAETARVCDATDAALNEARLAEAIRQTDRLVRHLIDRQLLAARLTSGGR